MSQSLMHDKDPTTNDFRELVVNNVMTAHHDDVRVSSSNHLTLITAPYPPPPPPPPQFSMKLLLLESKSLEQPARDASHAFPPTHPPPPIFMYSRLAVEELSFKTPETVFMPPLPEECLIPPPPPQFFSSSSCNSLDNVSVYSASESAPDSTDSESSSSSTGISQWVTVVDTSSPVEMEMVVGMWEKHTKGIGGKLLERMGYIRGLGLGKTSQGRLLPVEAVTCSGLGQPNQDPDLNPETEPGSESSTGTKRSLAEFGDNLYATVNTKPVGSGGFKKKKNVHSTTTVTKKKETVFDFLNKIPSSASNTVKSAATKIIPRKEVKKITCKSAF